MAYTSAPETQTHSTQRVPLVHDLILKPGGASFSNPVSGTQNVVIYKDENELYGETRLPIRATRVTSAGTTHVMRGLYVWEKSVGTTYFFAVTTDGATSSVWTATSVNGPWAAVNTITNASTPVRFAEFISSAAVKSLVMVTGTEGYVFTSNAAGTQIVDVDFPNPHVPFPVFLDGYLFLAKADTGDIYNSDLDNPTAWTAGNYISAEMYPDNIQALVKVNNYLLAVGTQSCEYFYDAANATGSPMARQEGAVLPFGTLYPNSIAASKNTVVMLANNNDGDMVFKAIEDFKHQEIPARAVLSVLTTMIGAGYVSPSTVRGYFLRQNGELMYVFNMRQSDAAGFKTPVFFFQSRTWGLFIYNQPSGNNYPFPVYFSAPQTSGSTGTYIAGHLVGRPFVGLFTSVDGAVDSIGEGNAEIYEELTTPSQDFGTLNRKFLSRIGIYYNAFDGIPGNAPSLSYGENNRSALHSPRQFQDTWFTETAAPNAPYPFLTQLGSFRSRWFQVYNQQAIRRIWRWLECDINKGQQ